MKVTSIQIGTPQQFGDPASDDPIAQVFTSAIGKEPVQGRIWVGDLGLAGDTVVDKRVHGGPDQAVLAYSANHYPLWRKEWGQDDLRPGAFGENLTVTDTHEDAVCVGDRWKVGEVLFEVTKPRTPCMTLARRHRRPDMIKVVHANGRSGWYLRVRQEGWIEAGTSVELLDRPYPQWPVRRVQVVMANRGERVEEARLLAQCPALAEDWRFRLSKEKV